MVGIGVDFGTSNSTIAWFDGKNLHHVSVEGSSAILPTAVHLNRLYAAITGTDAIDLYVEENRGRLVQLVTETIGEETVSLAQDSRSGGQDMRRVVYGPLIDRGLQGRLFLGLKRLLGDRSTHSLVVFDRPYRIVALITPVLERLRLAAESSVRRETKSVHVGRPVDFEGGDRRRNDVAMARLAEACGHAGFQGVSFYPEPVAATLSYLFREAPRSEGVALTVDFGGGTLDLSVIRHAGTSFEVLATAGRSLGGDRIDQLIFEQLLFPLLGKGEMWAPEADGRAIPMPFPFEEYESSLLNWPTTYLLNQNATKTRVLESIAQGGPAAEKFQRLNDLISYNYSYNCFRAIKQAKAELSRVEQTILDIPELDLALPFSREQLNAILVPVLEALRQAIEEVLSAAGLRREDIHLAIRTGGSSEIVAVRQLLEELFPGKLTVHDPFTSVAGGSLSPTIMGISSIRRAADSTARCRVA
ncbi:MAG: Hsp70 family protein [Gammaproteobacteria bacterium]